jgi:hypothetical protein
MGREVMMRRVRTAIRHRPTRAPLRALGGLSAALIAAAGGLAMAMVLSASAATPSNTLSANGTLGSGHAIVSPDGHFTLEMFSDGNLEERITGGRAVWSTGTYRYPGARAFMATNGNLAVYDTSNSAVWSSNSKAAGGCPRLVLQDDGNAVIYATKAIWSATSRVNKLAPGDVLEAGWSIYSIGPEDYYLHMNQDGNLALDDHGKELWTTGTYKHPGAYASMQTDGNLVVYSPTGHVLWSSETNGHPHAYLEVLGDGNADLIAAGKVIWRTGTYHKGNGISVAPAAPAPVHCPAAISPVPTTTVTTAGPVVTVPVPTPIPRPAPRARHLRVKLTISWSWNRATTRVRKIKVGSFPGRTRIWVQCKGRGCPRHRRKDAARGPGGVKRVLRGLQGRRYRAGDRLLIFLRAPGYRDQRAQVSFRNGRLPAVKLLRS